MNKLTKLVSIGAVAADIGACGGEIEYIGGFDNLREYLGVV